MKWLLSLLGLTDKKSTTTNSKTKDDSFLKIKQTPGALHCQWQLREETKAMIDRGFGSKIFIRIRDISGDHSIASKTIEVRSNQTEASIDLPVAAGKILVDLGYRYDADFISLEYQILNFGKKVIHPPRYTDWFTQESPNIHQEMYDLASTGRTLGGSEMGQGHS